MYQEQPFQNGKAARAVSYTHLDVYKRQLTIRASSTAWRISCSNTSPRKSKLTRGLLKALKRIWRPWPPILTPVSYTHLDVYKRQPPYNVGDIVYLDDRPHQITELRDDTVQLLPTGMSYPCLLYTSRCV